ncbi:MAG TPA: 3D domain-containing protein [Polyangiaceae bacterium]|nr:3D domain-containing protein [Polyangiaceae bacterium]
MNAQRWVWLSLAASAWSCATAGNTWMNQPLSTGAWGDDAPPANSAQSENLDDPKAVPPARVQSRVLSDAPPNDDRFTPLTPSTASSGSPTAISSPPVKLNPRATGGRVLGTFRNTYYDFPSEADFSGETVSLKNPRCKTIKSVARTFYESLCVQGSGTLSSGSTVSFAKRDCECAELCPRTGQHICFDELDSKTYPWGRGATGRAITPLVTIAVDSDLIPLDTPVYIPEYDGIPRDPARSTTHDGCFIAQDRGVRVKGEHVDVFTGHREITALWNNLVPSNRGVTVIVDHPRCARVAPSR